MKNAVLRIKITSLFISLLIFTLLFNVIFPSNASAQGWCECNTSVDPFGCDAPEDPNCDTGYQPVCGYDTASGVCVWCRCELPPPVPGGDRIDFDELIGVATPNFNSDSTLGDIISGLLPYIFYLAGFLILLYGVMGGYQIMNSQGDPKAIAQGRDKITYAIVGFIVMVVSYWILQLVGRILDIQQIVDIFG